MKEQIEVKVPEEIRKAWEEARLCASLINAGKARIVMVIRPNGSTSRYTKLK